MHVEINLFSENTKRIKSSKKLHCGICNKRKLEIYEHEQKRYCYFCLLLLITESDSPLNQKVNGRILSDRISRVYADGGLLAMNAHGGTWAFCYVDKHGMRIYGESGVVLPNNGAIVTNNHTELIALIKALETLPRGWSGTICSDSQNALGRMFPMQIYGKEATKYENIPPSMFERMKKVVLEVNEVEIVLHQGHPTEEDLRNGIGAKRGYPVSIHQHWCDIMCEKERKEYFEK